MMTSDFRYCPTQPNAMTELDTLMTPEMATGTARHTMFPSARPGVTAFHIAAIMVPTW